MVSDAVASWAWCNNIVRILPCSLPIAPSLTLIVIKQTIVWSQHPSHKQARQNECVVARS
jgi:hypothetical protein